VGLVVVDAFQEVVEVLAKPATAFDEGREFLRLRVDYERRHGTKAAPPPTTDRRYPSPRCADASGAWFWTS